MTPHVTPAILGGTVQVKASLLSLLVILILASFIQPVQETRVHPASEVLQENYKLGWKLPAGELKSATVSQDGQKILLSVFFNGYYLYDSKGQLIWRMPDPYTGFGEFSADGKSILLTDSWHAEGQKVSLIDAANLHEKWDFTLDRVNYARLSPGSQRAVILGAVTLADGRSQKLLIVKETDGTDLLNLKFGHSGMYLEFDEGSQPAISWDGRYVAVGTWGREERDYWLYFGDLDSGKSWNATVPSGVRFVAISPNATLVAAATAASTAAGPRSIHAFDKKGKLLWSASPETFASIEFWEFLGVSDSGGYLAVAGRGSLEGGYAMLFDRSGKELWEFQTPSRLKAFATDDEASRFVVGDSDGIVYFLDSSGKVVSRRSLVSEVVSVALGGKPGIIVAVGNDNVTYVMDTQANLLWTHVETGLGDVNISADGKRIRVGSTVFDENGKRLFTFNTGGLLTSDGRLLVILSAQSIGDHAWKPILTWFDVDAGRQVRNVTLGENEMVDSLSMSDDGSLLAVSGSVTDTYTFIYAFDSQGRRLWEHIDKPREPYLLVHSKVQVSGNGLYLAAARWESGIFGGGTNNGVVLLNNQGKVLWNYTTQEFALDVAVAENGEYVAAGSSSKTYEFDKDGRLLWSIPTENGMVAISRNGQRVVGGAHIGREMFLGNQSGPYWRMEVGGDVESVAISDSGDTSVAVISRDYPDARTARLIYVMDDKGSLVANYTFIGPTQKIGGSRVAISGNGCRIVAALETDGVYYFERIEAQTTTISTFATSMTPSATASTPTTSPGGFGIQPTLAMVVLVGAVGLATLLFVMKYRSRARARGRVPAGPRATI